MHVPSLTDAVLDRYTRLVSKGRDRGDVPGWVLITVMTAGLVMALWYVAGPKLQELLEAALDSVNPPS
jgi:hypothetical protein